MALTKAKTRKYKFPRRFSRGHCMRKTCKKMGFTEKASCRPYKNCYMKGGAYNATKPRFMYLGPNRNKSGRTGRVIKNMGDYIIGQFNYPKITRKLRKNYLNSMGEPWLVKLVGVFHLKPQRKICQEIQHLHPIHRQGALRH